MNLLLFIFLDMLRSKFAEKFLVLLVHHISGADINDDYFIQINRGGLTVASDLILELAKLTLSIMTNIRKI
jgi:hypothetical protein